jgi:xylan 1,4-beta-xylosidase
MSEGVSGSPDVGVLATRSANGSVDILLWHYQDDGVAGPAAGVRLVLTGLAPGLPHKALVWRVDGREGNAFASWQDMGSPSRPTKRQIDRLIRAARMTARPVRIEPQRHVGSVSLNRRLPLQSVELIEVRARHP